MCENIRVPPWAHGILTFMTIRKMNLFLYWAMLDLNLLIMELNMVLLRQ